MGTADHLMLAIQLWLGAGCRRRRLVPSIVAFSVDVMFLQHLACSGHDRGEMEMQVMARQASMDRVLCLFLETVEILPSPENQCSTAIPAVTC